MNIPVPNFIETKAIFSQGCGCDSYRNDNIRRDCYWYYCEHDMGASIDCCTLCDGLGECPCAEDCENYISNKEVTKQLKYRMPKKVTHNATLYKCCTCPSCGNVIDRFMDWNGERTRIMDNYCHFCGQALDWNDQEKQTARM